MGEPHCHQTRVGEVRRGVLTVIVAHPTLLEELAAFRKPELLQALRAAAPATTIHDIRFRVGPVDQQAACGTVSPPVTTAAQRTGKPGYRNKSEAPTQATDAAGDNNG